MICSPMNADFDGDALVSHLVSEEAKEDTYRKMSPRYMNIYKKSLSPIYVFSLESLNGLACLTEVTDETGDSTKDPKEYYTSYTELLKDAEIKKTLPINKPIMFTGKVGDMEFQNKKTTYGRLRLSKMIGADLDLIQDPSGKPICPWPKRIDAKSASALSLYLYQFPDGVERIKEIQKYALKVVTKAGVVSFDFKTLWLNTNNDTYKKMVRIADSEEYTDKQKLLLLTDLHHKYEKELEKTEFSPELQDELKRAGKIKLSSIIDMSAPALIIDGVDEKPIIQRSTLVSGLTEDQFRVHAVENRALQSIKNSGVPSSGLTSRVESTIKCKNCWKLYYLLENQQLTNKN